MTLVFLSGLACIFNVIPHHLLVHSFDFLFECYNDLVTKHLRHLLQAQVLSLWKEEIDSEEEDDSAYDEDYVELVSNVCERRWCRLEEADCC